MAFKLHQKNYKMKTLADLPKDITLVDYFKNMNIFEKRQVLDELSGLKLSIDTRLISFKKVMAFVALVSFFGIISIPNIWPMLYFGSINLGMFILFLKYSKKSSKCQFVIDYLTNLL